MTAAWPTARVLIFLLALPASGTEFTALSLVLPFGGKLSISKSEPQPDSLDLERSEGQVDRLLVRVSGDVQFAHCLFQRVDQFCALDMQVTSIATSMSTVKRERFMTRT